jgi:glycine/D-amino acid oxidase-like deaminating enzyme
VTRAELVTATLPHEARSLWRDGTATTHAPLDGDRRAHVVVVGAGIAGLTTALELARAGTEVVVLDARTVGAGTTGRTTAKVSALQGTIYRQITATHGVEAAQRYAAAQLAALRWIANEIGVDEVACEWQRRPAITYAASPEDRSTIEEEVAAATAAGLPVELVDDVDLPFPTYGAARLADQAQFHPQEYLEALADQVIAHGGTIHEHTNVTGVHPFRQAHVDTERGTVHAEHLVVTTLLPITEHGMFFARAEPRASYAMALRVAGEPPAGMYLSSGSPTRSLRTVWTGDETLLLVGGNGHVVGRQAPTLDQYQDLLDWSTEHFTVTDVVARWSAHDYVSVDHLPFIGPAWPGLTHLQVATGFGKWGMTNGTVAGILLADRILGRSDRSRVKWSSLFDPGRVAAKSVPGLAKLNGEVAVNLVKGWVRPEAPAGPDGQGRRRRSGLHPTGQVDTAAGPAEGSVVCTHLGGVCTWNDGDRTWDCPLHGSRFAADGTVLDGPASKPLAHWPGGSGDIDLTE